ncbi:MAG TPA: phage tail protein [Clostridiales bacterium]|jgi:uncharacterized phage protein gp47/JayE|nr:phage tail protein [Clostridiales bacterium]HBR09251.1 phage tail protein [Clostridiales bacterium]
MKTTDELYAEMKATYAQATGLALNDGGDMALRLYAAAAQLSSLWAQADFVARQSFPQTAQGDYLDYHAEIRGVERAAASKAAGTIRFYIPSALENDLTIPEGVVCMTAAETGFVTTAPTEIKAGELYGDAAAQAVEAGASGNAPAFAISYMTLAPTGVSACANPEAFRGGAQAEDDNSLRKRVVESYQTLPNGANAAYYEAQALNTDGVAAVSVIPKHRGIGTVDVFIAAWGGIPPQALVDAVQEKLDARREICVDISVSAPEAVGIAVEAAVSAGAGYSQEAVATAVEAALNAYFTGERLGRDVLLAELGNVIFSVGGVKNYRIVSPASDIGVTPGQLPVLESVAVTEMV